MDQVCPKRMNIIQGDYIKLWNLTRIIPNLSFIVQLDPQTLLTPILVGKKND